MYSGSSFFIYFFLFPFFFFLFFICFGQTFISVTVVVVVKSEFSLDISDFDCKTQLLLCTLTHKRVLRMPLAGQNHIFRHFECFSVFFINKRKKEEKAQKLKKTFFSPSVNQLLGVNQHLKRST